MSEDTALLLVVDDNEMNRDMLSRRLKRQGYEIEMAEDGLAAIEAMQATLYDLVLLDVMMPRMNGYEVLEKVREDDSIKKAPIIMISAMDDLDSVVKCIELGAEDYLFKPFNPVLLKARVGASLEKNRAASGRNSIPKADIVSGLNNIQALMADLSNGELNSEQQNQVSQIEDTLQKLMLLLG